MKEDTEVEKSKVDLGMSQACCCPLSCSCSTDLSSHPSQDLREETHEQRDGEKMEILESQRIREPEGHI